LGDGDRQSADRRGLSGHEQDLAPLFQLPNQGTQFGLLVRQGLVEEHLPSPVHGDCVVLALANMDADEDVNAVAAVDQGLSASGSSVVGLNRASSPGIHVTHSTGRVLVKPLSEIIRRESGR